MILQFLATITLLSTLYAFCHIGDHVRLRFESVNISVYQLAWNELPLHAQKNLIILLAASQRDIYIRGVGNIHCTRQIFLMVKLMQSLLS